MKTVALVPSDEKNVPRIENSEVAEEWPAYDGPGART
jgi:hypothetical protein